MAKIFPTSRMSHAGKMAHAGRKLRVEQASSNECQKCGSRLVEIDHYGERLTGCPVCNLWQDADGVHCRLAPDDIIALRALKTNKVEPK